MCFFFLNLFQEHKFFSDDITLPLELKEISVFWKYDACEQFKMNPENALKKMIGINWGKEENSQYKLCTKFLHYYDYDQGIFKKSVRSLIAYMHNNYEKTLDPKKRVDSVPYISGLLVNLVRFVKKWINDHWTKNVEKYVKYRSKEELQGGFFQMRYL